MAEEEVKESIKEETEEKPEVTQAEGSAEAKPKAKRRKKAKKSVAKGLIFISSSFNNTIVTITDASGNVIAWSSAGSLGFKGSKKGTPYAAGLAASTAVNKAKNFGLSSADIFVSGIGSGRETALRSIISEGIKIAMIKDTTPIPHNGCRPKKVRRV